MSDIEENSHLYARKRGKRCKRGSPPMYNEEEKFNILIGNIKKVKGRKSIKRKNIADSDCEDELNASAPLSDQVVVDASKNSDSNAKIDAWHQEETEMYQAYGETFSKRARLNDENGREEQRDDGETGQKEYGDEEWLKRDGNVTDFSQARSPTYLEKSSTIEETVDNIIIPNDVLTDTMRAHCRLVSSEWKTKLELKFKSHSITPEEYQQALNTVVKPLLGDGDWTIQDLLEWIMEGHIVTINKQNLNTSSNEASTPTVSGPNAAAVTHGVEATNAGETDAEATRVEATEAEEAEATEAEATEADATEAEEAAFGLDEEATTPDPANVKSPEVMFLDSSDDEEEGQKVEEEEPDDSSKDTEDDSDDDDPFYSEMNN